MEINLNGGTKICVDGKKRSTQMKGEGRKDEYRGHINKRDRFRACQVSSDELDAKLGRAVFF